MSGPVEPAADSTMNEVIDTAKEYWVRVHRHGRSHYLAGKHAERLHNWIGVPVVITTTIVGTTIFSTISTNPDLRLQIATGLLSLGAAVLSALQTFFNFSERAMRHRQAGANYSEVRRDLELFILRYKGKGVQDRNQAIEDLQTLAEKVSELENDSPDVPDRMYDKAADEQKRDKAPFFLIAPEGAGTKSLFDKD